MEASNDGSLADVSEAPLLYVFVADKGQFLSLHFVWDAWCSSFLSQTNLAISIKLHE